MPHRIPSMRLTYRHTTTTHATPPQQAERTQITATADTSTRGRTLSAVRSALRASAVFACPQIPRQIRATETLPNIFTIAPGPMTPLIPSRGKRPNSDSSTSEPVVEQAIDSTRKTILTVVPAESGYDRTLLADGRTCGVLSSEKMMISSP